MALNPNKPAPAAIRRALRDWSEDISTWRGLIGLTQAQLADRAGISRQTIIRLEKGDGGVSIENLLRVLRALGILQLLSKSLDPYESDLGRLRSDEALAGRAHRHDRIDQDA